MFGLWKKAHDRAAPTVAPTPDYRAEAQALVDAQKRITRLSELKYRRYRIHMDIAHAAADGQVDGLAELLKERDEIDAALRPMEAIQP